MRDGIAGSRKIFFGKIIVFQKRLTIFAKKGKNQDKP